MPTETVDTADRVNGGEKQPHVDPARDVRDDIMDANGVPELLDKIWFHKTASAVIDADRCVGCGACIAACPSKSIGVGSDGLPTLVRMCTGCSACWDYCPMAGFRPEKLNHQDAEDPVGPMQQAVSARALARPDGAQDGGAVTTLLATLIVRTRSGSHGAAPARSIAAIAAAALVLAIAVFAIMPRRLFLASVISLGGDWFLFVALG